MRSMLIATAGMLAVAAVFYGLLCAALYFNQDSLIFYRVVNDAGAVERLRAARVEIRPAQGVDQGPGFIEGWWIRNPNKTNDAVVLYFGGNAEDVLYTADDLDRFGAEAILLSNYRGYGKTPGRPDEAAIYSDALAIYDWVARQPGVTGKQIFVMGRSLGSGVATYLAAHRPVRGAVLITPYDSLAQVGQKHYPYFPVGRLIRHKFPSADYARTIDVPVRMIGAENDRVVPLAHARNLFEAWRGPKKLVVLAGVGHNDVQAHRDFHRTIRDFLSDTR